MSGRSGFRKTDRKVLARTSPADLPPIVLSFALPPQLAGFVAPGPTGIMGVVVKERGRVEIEGRERAWLLAQASAFLKSIARGHMPAMTFGASMERQAYDGPTDSSPRQPGFRDLYTIAIASGDPVILMTPGGTKHVTVA